MQGVGVIPARYEESRFRSAQKHTGTALFRYKAADGSEQVYLYRAVVGTDNFGVYGCAFELGFQSFGY